MVSCDVCDTNSAPSYYSPRELNGIVMCPQCHGYTAFIDWHLNRNETIAALKRVKEKRESMIIAPIRRDGIPISLKKVPRLIEKDFD